MAVTFAYNAMLYRLKSSLMRVPLDPIPNPYATPNPKPDQDSNPNPNPNPNPSPSPKQVPLLIPGLLYRLDAELECIDETGGADAIRIFVCSTKSVLPVLSAVVNMPVSETMLDAGGPP